LALPSLDPVSYAIRNSARLINEFEACSIEIGTTPLMGKPLNCASNKYHDVK